MQKRHEQENPRFGEEFFPPCEEFPAVGEEFSPPAQEFPLHKTLQQSNSDDSARKRRLRKKLLCLAAAFIVVIGIALPKRAPRETPQLADLPPETQATESAPAPTETVSLPTETETQPPETLPAAPTFPLADGTLEITVFNSSPDAENGWIDLVLYQGSFAEADFTELILPAPVQQEGYVFLGFVLSGGSRTAGESHHYLLQDILRSEDVALVAPDEDGVRHVNIHAAWYYAAGDEPWMPLILDGNGGTPTVEYDAAGPLASGSTVYPCAYPTPQRAGYLFAGWYETADCTGKPVEAINAHAFFAEGEDGPNWRISIPFTLYARWLPEP